MLNSARRVIALLIVPAALLAFCFQDHAQADWTKAKTSVTNSSRFHSIAVHNGTVFIGFAHSDQAKVSITNSTNGSDWSGPTEIVQDSGTGLSLALNSTGLPHLSYGGTNTTNATKLAYQNGTTEIVDEQGFSHLSTSLEFDAQDQPHVSYYQLNSTKNRVRYAMRNETGKWEKENVSNANERYTSMTIDNKTSPHVVYIGDEKHLYHAYKYNSSWKSELIDDTSSFRRNDIAVDNEAVVHLSYFDYTNKELRYTLLSDDISYIIDYTNDDSPIGKYNSLAVDSDNNPHIAYSGQNGAELKYAYYNGTDWKRMTIDSNATWDISTSLVLQEQENDPGIPHISYHTQNGTLKYATNENFYSDVQNSPSEDPDKISLPTNSDSNDDGGGNGGGGGGGGGGCTMSPEVSFGAGWLLLLLVPLMALRLRRSRA